MSTSVKTIDASGKIVGNLKYCFIKGEGRNQAMQGQEPKMQFTASVSVPENGPVHKHVLGLILEEWDAYKKAKGVKGLPSTNGIKPEMIADPKGTIDPATEEVARIPSGNVLIQFKTNTKFKDGKSVKVKVYDGKGSDITEAFHAADWSIGEGSTGVIHGTASANDVGGKHKVTLYLNAVQIAKLVKYEGTSVDVTDIGGDDIEIEGVEALDSDNTPDI